MPRKRTPDQSSTDTESTTSTAIAEPETSEIPEQKQSFADRVGQRKQWVSGPDPFGIATDSVAGVRLFESRQDRQMAIKFNEKPPQVVLDKMHEAGWSWKSAHGIWAYPVRPDSAVTTRIKAERLYQEVRQMIRQEKGIEAGPEIPF
jgi:hypothetical protein